MARSPQSLTEQFGPNDYLAHNAEQIVPLFVVTAEKALQVVTVDAVPSLQVRSTVLSLVPATFKAVPPAEPDADRVRDHLPKRTDPTDNADTAT